MTSSKACSILLQSCAHKLAVFVLIGGAFAVVLSVETGCMSRTSIYNQAPETRSDQGGKEATFATETAAIVGENVPASDYTISFAPMRLEKDVNGVVQAATDYAQLTAHVDEGQDYAIVDSALNADPTIGEVDAAFTTALSHGAISSLTALQLPAGSFQLEGATLPATRTLIIRNTKSSVSSYQLVNITFV